ncbi:Hypothetical protein PHPALM_18745 [Phytophthora palmivora]|uniref:Reverse transcriptase domain-containing protein n=1 Tax=Phytophthora palmivora TaxID=4796 RepID=A0A2P4XIX6_9STRA|nr:Hypothetical protein PHPALM_18745 [Phytophthora palmivora]
MTTNLNSRTVPVETNAPAMAMTASAIMPPMRREYVDAIEACCAVTSEDKIKALRSVKNSFDTRLLESLCKYEWGTTVDLVTEERIIRELNKIVGSVMNDQIVDIDALFNDKLKIDLRERDVKARVLKYFMLCEEIILHNDLTSTFSTSTGSKEKCKLLKKHLEPVALRDSIDAHQRIVDSSSMGDEQKLYRLEKVFSLLTKRKQQQINFATKGEKPKQSQEKRLRGGGSGTSRDHESSHESGANRNTSGTNHSVGGRTNRTVTASGIGSNHVIKSKPRSGCFYCHKDHRLSECPDIDEAEKEAILAKRKNKLSGSTSVSSNRFRAKRVEPITIYNGNGKPTVILNGVLELPYCADSGSDFNMVSRRHVVRLCQLDNSVQLVRLTDPIESRAVGGALLVSTHAIDINITLNTAAGPSEEEEVLVGKILLAELSIDINHQLEHFASRGDDDETFDDPEGMPVCTPVSDEIVMNVVDALVHDAVGRGVIDDYIMSKLYTTLRRFGGWRLELGNDPPARVPPLKLRLKKNAALRMRHLTCANFGQYSPEKSEFLEAFNKKLVEMGWVYETRESRWCCPALPVKRPSTSDYHQTVDYRPANALTEPIAGVMPSIEVALEHCRGKAFYALFDFLKGFWQLPLHESCREFLSYMTDKGVFTPTRVPQGSTDAALHFQSTVEMVLGDLVGKCVIVWIDDLLVFAESADQLVESIDAILQKLDEHGFILNPKKCSLFLTEDGIGHDPIRIQALREMSPPTTAAELQRFICASNWMRAGLVDYSRVARPLQERLDIALAGSKKTKRAAAGIQLGLAQEELSSFAAVKDLLANSAILAYPDASKQMIVMSDASDVG